MFLKRAVFENFGCHRHLEVNFVKGLNGIVGSNGSGKSTITRGLFGAITNDFGRFGGKREQRICDFAPEEEPSFILVEGEHNGVPFELQRGFRRAKDYLKVGDLHLKKATEIEEELTRRLGATRRLLDRYVFVDQWQTFAFLDQTPGERAAAYQVLCGTEKAEQVCLAIEQFLKIHADLAVDVIDNTADTLAAIAAEEQAIAARQHERDQAAANILSAADAERYRLAGRRRGMFALAAEEVARLTPQVARLQADVERFKQTHLNKAKLLRELEALLAELKPTADEAKASLDGAVAYSRGYDRWQKQQARKRELEVALNSLKAVPPLHPEHARRDELAAAQAADLAEVKRIERVLSAFARDGVVECPTCGTPVTSLDEHLAELRASLPKYKAAAAAAEKKLAAIAAASRAVAEHTKLTEIHSRDLAVVNASILELAAYAQEPASGEISDAWQQAIADYAEQVRNLPACRDAVQSAAVALARAESSLASTSQSLTDAQRRRELNVVSDSELATAESALRLHDAARLAVAGHDAALEQHRRTLAGRQAELERTRTLLRRNRQGRALVTSLRRIREEVLHRQALPQWVAQRNLEDVEGDLNAALARFGDPFWVEASADLSFTVHFPGCPPRPAAWLSGGERSVLGIAFREAMAGLFDSDLDLLVLDEPAAGMDSKNVGFLAEALTKYAEEVRGRRQVILISHADSLKSSFDHVVEVGGGPG